MTTTPIDSPTNPKIKYLSRLLRDSKFRRTENVFVLEGGRYVAEAIERAHNQINCIISTHDVETFSGSQWILSPKIYRELSQLGPSDEVMAIIKRPIYQLETLDPSTQMGVVLDHVQNPQNVGAIIRTAVAFGAEWVMLTPGSCDPFHPESLRAMAGNWHQIPIGFGEPQSLEVAIPGLNWVILDGTAHRDVSTIAADGPTVIVIGSEGNGPTHPLFRKHIANFGVSIPMAHHVESLNAAVAAGIVLHHVHRVNPQTIGDQ